MIYLGIDPGAKGAAVALDDRGLIVGFCPYAKKSPAEIVQWLGEVVTMADIVIAAIERVHSMPEQGVASTFAFGRNYGWWQGVIDAYGIRVEQEPSPQMWQKAMGCLTKGDKNVSKAAAHRLWPDRVKELTHATADAALIAEWLRRYGRTP